MAETGVNSFMPENDDLLLFAIFFCCLFVCFCFFSVGFAVNLVESGAGFGFFIAMVTLRTPPSTSNSSSLTLCLVWK